MIFQILSTLHFIRSMLILASAALFITMSIRTSLTVGGADYDAVSFRSIQFRLTHVCSVLIWCLVTVICRTLGYQMNSLESYTFKVGNAMYAQICYLVLFSIVVVSIISYEVWMFAYIFQLYVTSLTFCVQLFILMPFFALITHSIHQTLFLMYSQDCSVRKNPENVSLHIIISWIFNCIMLCHLISMGTTAFFTHGGIFNGNHMHSAEMYIILPLGFVEFGFRMFALMRYFKLWTIYKHIFVAELMMYKSAEKISEQGHLVHLEIATRQNSMLFLDLRPSRDLELDYQMIPYSCSDHLDDNIEHVTSRTLLPQDFVHKIDLLNRMIKQNSMVLLDPQPTRDLELDYQTILYSCSDQFDDNIEHTASRTLLPQDFVRKITI